MPRVFISHSSRDREVVEREIISPLRAHGVEIWYSRDDIKSASEWERQIRKGLRECDWFLVALSPRSVASEWVEREVHWAFIKRKDKIIPVMLETCEPDDLHIGLLPIQFIDFRNGFEHSLERLLNIWGLDVSTQVNDQYRAAQDVIAKEDWATAVEKLEAVLRLDPSHLQAQAGLNHARRQQELASLYETGVIHLRQSRWHEALETLQQLREMDSHYDDVDELMASVRAELDKVEAERLYREAAESMDREEWAKAVEQFQAVLELSSQHAEAQAGLARSLQQREVAELYAAGLAHLQSGRWREALKSFRRVRSIDRSYKGIGDLIADADAGLEKEEEQRAETEKEERGAKEEAKRQAQPPQSRVNTEAQCSTDEEAPQSRGTADSVRAKNTSRKKNKLVKVLTISVGVIVLFIIVRALLPKSYTSRSDNVNTSVIAPITQASEHHSKAEALSEQKKYAEAESEYRKALEFEPNNANYHHTLGASLYYQEKFAEAEAECRKAIELEPNYGRYHKSLGTTLFFQNKYGEAEAEYRRAIELNPNDGSFYQNLGSLLYRQKKYGEAEAEFRKAIELDPKDADYHTYLGNAFYLQSKYGEAETEYRKAVELIPSDSRCHYNLGLALNYQSKYGEAEAEYRKAIELGPKDADYHTSLAINLHNQDKHKEEAAENRKALQIDPNNKLAQQNLKSR